MHSFEVKLIPDIKFYLCSDTYLLQFVAALSCSPVTFFQRFQNWKISLEDILEQSFSRK